MKRFELFIALILIPLDFVMLLLAATLAYFLRFEGVVTQYRPVLFEIPFSDFLYSAISLIILWMIIFALAGLYSINRPNRILREIKQIFVASSLGLAAITVTIFLRGELFDSRFIVLAAYVLAIILVVLARFMVRYLRFAFYKRKIGVRRVVLVGNDETAQAIDKYLARNYREGRLVVHRIKNVGKDSLDQLKNKLNKIHPDLILQASVNLSKKETESLLDFAQENHLQFHYVANLYDTKASNTDISTIGDIPLIEIKQTPLQGWGRIIKRTFDLVVGFVLFVISIIPMLLIALAIKLESKGSVIYKNERVGKGGKLFNLYKFRRFKQEYCTGMDYDATGEAIALEKELIKTQSKRRGPIYKVINDPRSSKVGAWLEKTSLDELPQFLNVLKGDLSLVGPRPHQPREVAGYVAEHKQVFAIKPGVTGLAQISGRSDLDYSDEVRLDTYYIENWTLRKDIAILLKTPLAVLRKHK